MKKQTKVLVAATLLTLGASFSSMAALKNGTWEQNENGWQYIDRDGEYVESEWCYSGTEEFWINEEGFLGSNEWVSDEKHTYYVKEDGSKATNKWMKLYAEDDEDAEEESWFYFDAKGRMYYNKAGVTIGDYKYYIDKDGKMLTGWVDTEDLAKADTDTTIDNVVFCNDDEGSALEGSLVKSAWLNEFPWDADLDEMYEGDDEQWYYAGSKGNLLTGKQDGIAGQTYFFNKKTGVMIEGWVVRVANGVDDKGKTTYVYTASNGTKFTAQGATEVYFATEDGAGYAKKNSWRELTDPTGDSNYWYHFDKLGKVYLGKATNPNAQKKTFDNGENYEAPLTNKDDEIAVEAKKFNGVTYYFNAEGEMLDGLVEINGKLMYLDGGAAQTGKVTLTDDNENDYTFCFGEKTADGYTKYVAVTGNKDNFLYVNGLLVKAEESGEYKLVETSAGDFIVDYRGKIQHNSSKDYFGNKKTYDFSTAKGAKKYAATEATK